MKAFIISVESRGCDYSRGATFSQSVDGDSDLCGAIEALDQGPLDSEVSGRSQSCVLNLTSNDCPIPDFPKARWACEHPRGSVCLVLTGSGQKAKQMKGAAVTLA